MNRTEEKIAMFNQIREIVENKETNALAKVVGILRADRTIKGIRARSKQRRKERQAQV